MTLSYTARLKLAVPDFLTEPWHAEFAQAMESIDQIIYNAILLQLTDLWLNSHAYVIGDVVISPDSGALYTCGVAHTSTASPQTFTQELVAHPTYWTLLAPTLATQAEAEAGVENTKYMSALRTKQAITALSSQTSPVVPHSGRLVVTSGTTLSFTPYNGNKIKINGNLYSIPVAGIAGLATTGVYIAGTPGQNLVASTRYLIFAFITGGVVTADFIPGPSNATHRPSQTAGNEGVEVYYDTGTTTEDPTHTLIGIVYVSSGTNFIDSAAVRTVRSWFNRSANPMRATLSASVNVTAAAYAQISSDLRIDWVNFAGEVVHLEHSQPFFIPSAVLSTIFFSIGLDSTTVAAEAFAVTATDGSIRMAPLGTVLTPSEGFHFATPLVRSGATQVTCYSGVALGDRPVHRGLILPGSGNIALP